MTVHSAPPGGKSARAPSRNGNGQGLSFDIRAAVERARDRGICVIPPSENGKKQPWPGGAKWKAYESRPATAAEHARWYGANGKSLLTGMGAVMGTVSAPAGYSLNALDFDDRPTYEAFVEAARAVGLADLVDRIEAGYVEDTPKGGVHWLAYVPVDDGTPTWPTTKLAMRPNPTEKSPHGADTLIETKCEGGFLILAPTCGRVHPSGKPYVLRAGGLATIAELTGEEWQALCNLALTFDESPVEVESTPSAGEVWEMERPAAGRREGGVSPGDDFNARASWPDVLPAGWEMVYRRAETEYWRRPGKSEGVSATVNRNGSGRLYVFSSSTPFEVRKPYTKFAAFALLEHRNDFSAAAKALKSAGYGDGARGAGKGRLTVQAAGSGNGGGNGKAGGGAAAQPEPERSGVFDGMTDEELGIVDASTIRPEPVMWMWQNRIALGKVNLLAGEGGDGKSQLATAVVAAVTTGRPFPDGSQPLATGMCLILAAEDGARDTVIPRLMAAGADRTKVKVITAKVTTKDKDGKPLIHFMSFQDLAYWRAVFKRYPDTRLLIADPLPAYLGRGVNDHRNNEVRSVLEPFADLLDQAGVGALAVTHLNKSVETKTPTHRILGSVAYSNLARTVHVTCRDQSDKQRRMFCWVKGNLTEPQPTLAFRIVKHIVEDAGREIPTSRLDFEPGPVEGDAADIMSGKSGKRGPDPKKTVAVAEWLYDFLADGHRRPMAEIFDAAGLAGFVGDKRPEDKKWSNPNALYLAKKAVPNLPAPRNGKRVDDLAFPIRTGGRNIVHWHLVDTDAPY